MNDVDINPVVYFRVYADGWIISEDEFEDYDNSIPYYDDYSLIAIDEDMLEYIDIDEIIEGKQYEQITN